MSRAIGTKNKKTAPEIIQADETDRLKYLSALLLEIVEEELRESEVAICNPS
jgi:hypothetical protein